MTFVLRRICEVLVLLIFIKALASKPVENLIKNESFKSDKYYNFTYKLADGQYRKESGQLATDGPKDFYRVKGFYSYTAAGGRRVNVIYTADENGYRAKVIEKLLSETEINKDRLDLNAIKTLVGR